MPKGVQDFYRMHPHTWQCSPSPIGFCAKGSGFSVKGSGFSVKGSGFSVKGSGFSVKGAGFSAKGSGFSVKGTGFSPYINNPRISRASAPEGMRISSRSNTQIPA